MDYQTKLNLAVTRFAGFVSNLPLSPEQCDVLDYHEIVGLFEEAFRRDLSQFRIAPDRVQPQPQRTAVDLCGASCEVRHHTKNYVEYAYFRGQIRGLIACLMIVLEERPS